MSEAEFVIDWKYALSLELADPGFEHTVLSEFRWRLVKGSADHLLLDVLMEWFRELDLLKPGGSQRTDSTHVLAAVLALNRLELVGETMRHAWLALEPISITSMDRLTTILTTELCLACHGCQR